MVQRLVIMFIYLLGSAQTVLSDQIGAASVSATQSDIIMDQPSPSDVTESTNKKLDKKSDKRFFSYKLFRKEFILTTTVDDYRRSLARVSEEYNLNISKSVLDSLNKSLSWRDQEKVSEMVSILVLEGKKKAEFTDNRFYGALKRLEIFSNSFLLGASIEIELANHLRKLARPTPLINVGHLGYFRHLLNQARYEVFLYTLQKESM